MNHCPKCGAPKAEGPQCPECGVYYAKLQGAPPRETPPQSASPRTSHRPSANVQTGSPAVDYATLGAVLAFAGAVFIIVGVFSPFVTMPIAGSRNYIDVTEIDGFVLLGLAAVCIVAALLRGWFVVGATGVFSLAMVGYSFVEFQRRKEAVMADVRAELEGNPFIGLAEVTVGSVGLSWGVGLLFVGAVIILMAAFLGGKTTAV